MGVREYVRIIRQRWWVLVLVAVAAAVSAYVVSKLQTPLYRSRAAHVVRFNRLDTGGNLFAESIFNGYVNLLYEPEQLQAVSNRLALDLSGSQLLRYIRVQAQPSASLIAIEADHWDPSTARLLVDAVSQQLNAVIVEENRNLQGEDRVSLRVRPAQPPWLAKPLTRINLLAGALLGAILGVLLVFGLAYLDNTIHTAADIEQLIGTPVVGTIPGASYAGAVRSAA